MPRFITIGLQKGGVGKTATVVNLAAAAARRVDLRVLVLDFDEQRNATKGLMNGQPIPADTIESVLRGRVELRDAIVASPFATPSGALHLIPGTRGLSAYGLDLAKGDVESALFRFRDLIREGVPADDYDLVLIDTPPAGGFWLQTALAIADGYIIVTECEINAREALQDLEATVNAIRGAYNPDLQFDGLVMNKVDNRRTSAREAYLPYYRNSYPVLEPPITYATVVSDAAGVNKPVEFYARNSDSAKQYGQIAQLLNMKFNLGGVPVAP